MIKKLLTKNILLSKNSFPITKQKQWVRIANNIELLDTPGVLWPKFESEQVGLNLAYTGTIKDSILEITEIAYCLTKFLLENYRNNLLERYNLTSGILINPNIFM